MSKEGYLQLKLRDMEDKVLTITNLLEDKEKEFEIKNNVIKKQIEEVNTTFKPLIEEGISLRGLNNYILKTKDEQNKRIEDINQQLHTKIEKRLNHISRLLGRQTRKLINEDLKELDIRIDKRFKKVFDNVWVNIKILFTEFYGLLDKLKIERNELPNIPNEWSIRKATTTDIMPIVREALKDKIIPLQRAKK